MPHIPNGKTETLTGTIDYVTLGSNSTVILNNATVNGYIRGDQSTTVSTKGTCLLKGAVNCGTLNIGGNTTIGGAVGGPY